MFSVRIKLADSVSSRIGYRFLVLIPWFSERNRTNITSREFAWPYLLRYLDSQNKLSAVSAPQGLIPQCTCEWCVFFLRWDVTKAYAQKSAAHWRQSVECQELITGALHFWFLEPCKFYNQFQNKASSWYPTLVSSGGNVLIRLKTWKRSKREEIIVGEFVGLFWKANYPTCTIVPFLCILNNPFLSKLLLVDFDKLSTC